jgi:hypothetical protein
MKTLRTICTALFAAVLAASALASDLRYFGNTSNVVRFRLTNSSTGQGLTGLTSSSSGLIISTVADNEATATTYTVAGSTIESITTLGTFAAPTATKCRFKEVDATNQPGLYEFQIADARFAVSNSRRLVIGVTGATNLQDAAYEIQLLQVNPYSATAFLTGINSLAPPTNWNLLSIDGSGRTDIAKLAGSAIQQTGGYAKTIESAKPQTYYVAASGGSDSNSGLLRSAPLATIAAAETARSNGDTIFLIAGTHTQTSALTITKSGKVMGEGWTSIVSGDMGATAGVPMVVLAGDGITLENFKIIETNKGVGLYSDGRSNIALDRMYIVGPSDGYFSNLFSSGYAISIDRCRFESQWDGAVLGRWLTGRVTNSYFATTASYANGGIALPSAHGCTSGAASATASCLLFDGNTFYALVDNSSNVNNSTVVESFNVGEKTTTSGRGNDIVAVASKTSWAGTIAGIATTGDATNGVPLVGWNDTKITVTSTTGTPTKYDAWTTAGNAEGTIEFTRVKTTDGTAAAFSGSNIHTDLRSVSPLRNLVVDANGLADANAVKLGPSGSGTALTARDIGASVLLSNGTGTGQVGLSSGHISYVDTLTTYTGNTPQTGDSFARIGATGTGLTSLAPAAILATTNGAATVATQLQRLDAAVSSAAGALDWTSTQKAQILAALSVNQSIGVPNNLVWVIARKDGDIKPTATISKKAAEGVDVAADFRKLFGTSDAIASITSVSLVSGIVASPAFTDITQATLWMASAVRFHVTGGTAGASSVVRITVLTVGGNTYSADCEIGVK